MTTATLWEQYQNGGDVDARDALLQQHIGLVHHVARQLTPSAGADAEFDDLVSAGTIGLIHAVDTFDPKRGLAFSTYAAARIRGAILDDRRRRDHVPRSVRRKQRALKAAQEELRESLGREPEPAEIAATLGLDIEAYWKWRDQIPESERASLDAPVANAHSREITVVDVVVGDHGTETEDRINRQQEAELLAAEIGRLNKQERTVLALYYFEELKLHEIANVLGVTESRISQIRTRALRTLRERMNGDLR